VWRETTINLTDMLFSISAAMDLANPSISEHQIRSAYITWRMARTAKLPYIKLEKLFVASMLHDIGAFSSEEKIDVHRLYQDTHSDAHCLKGQRLFEEASWLAPAAPIVRWHHTTWLAHQQAGRSIEDKDVMASQMLLLADRLERFIRRDQFILHQTQTLRDKIGALSGKYLHSDVVALFLETSETDDFWLDLASPQLAIRLKSQSPLRRIEVDLETAKEVASVFKDITDFRSRFTASHSSGVAACASSLARNLSITGNELQLVEIAGYLHDVGKLVVPNSILTSSGPLSTEEFAVYRQHAHFTYRILSDIDGLELVAEWAGCHHERNDGSGYPLHLDESCISLGAKIIAVADVFTALSEDRPYRKRLSRDQVLVEMHQMGAANQLDRKLITALADNCGEIIATTRTRQDADNLRYLTRYAGF
jgi:HD-GYP domain-containing protein (c-di-GMP phosphodiesterase class II)